MTSLSIAHRAGPKPSLAVACLLLAWLALPAQAGAQPPNLVETVRAAMQNELQDSEHVNLFAWKTRKHHAHDTQVEFQVQTPSGIISRVVLIDDKPLSPAQKAKEEERVRKMLDPAELRRSQKDQQADDARTRKMLATIPDAFEFTYIESSVGSNDHKLTKIRFTPRAGFAPPNRETAVFTGMQGEILLDETAMRVAKIDGTLFKDVSFGWGILGRLYKGGRFVVEQSEITPSHWDTTQMLLHFDGKALLFKSIHIDENETSWDYQPVPAMTAEQALDYLNHSEAQQDAALHR